MYVTTTYSGATNTRGSRIIVKGDGRQKSFPFDYAARDAHIAAVGQFLEYLGYGTYSINVEKSLTRGYAFRVGF